MMDAVMTLALKSLLVAGAALLLLRLIRNRSAADRSLVAHLGLGAVLLLPIAWFAFPQLEITSSWVGPAPLAADSAPAVPVVMTEPAAASSGRLDPASTAGGAPIDWLFWLYVLPAGLLIGFTLIAVLRLALLKGRANVLVESDWLTALARAQRRMGFKSGTALLTSDELRSPISWGLMRPVILLSSEAADARDEAEAIIAHELAHVANFDWAKLLLARVAVALFWFNPLVWVLAREAHQLREEAADDAVLAADIEDIDYAQLLVGIARHECRGLLIGAHGVAPAKNSLARRVKRVLDKATARAPGGWRWTAAAGFFAAGMAVPLAALQLVPAPLIAASNQPLQTNADGDTVEGSPVLTGGGGRPSETIEMTAAAGQAAVTSSDGASAMAGSDFGPGPGPGFRPGPDPDLGAHIARRVHAQLAASGLDPKSRWSDPVDRLVEARAVGITPAYIAALREAAPHLRPSHDDLVSLVAVGVSPAYVREMNAAGLRGLDVDELVAARALGIDADYVREMNAAGFRGLDADELVAARVLGIDADYVRGMTKAGYSGLTIEQLTELSALGITPDLARRYRQAKGRPLSIERLIELKAVGIAPEELDPGADP